MTIPMNKICYHIALEYLASIDGMTSPWDWMKWALAVLLEST